MIVIDMDMPKCCGTCEMSGTGVCKEWINLIGYEMGQKRADACPIKCDIKDIKAEIEQIAKEESDEMKWSRGLRYALKIINKHTK